ncbi:MAG: hypothetical protein NVS1B2_01120 [Vulcanimicrobiaceae bacterium]
MNRTDRREIIQSAAARTVLARRRKIAVFSSIAIAALIVLIAIVLATNRAAVPVGASHADGRAALKVGDRAPEFVVSTTAGPFDLAKAGKPVLLEVFASWCPHCQREVPVLNKLATAYAGKARVVSVAGSPYGLDQSVPESQADVVAFIDKYHATYPIAFDPNLDVAKKYLQGGFPTVVLIGADGVIKSIRDGEIPATDLRAALDASIAGKKPDPRLGAR